MWDASKDQWQPDAKPTLVRFRPDGLIAQVDSRISFTYNEAGRLLETKFQNDDGSAGTVVHAYDEDEKGRLIRTVSIDEKGIRTESEIFRYDSSGRKTRIQFVPKRENDVPFQYPIDGTELSIGASGAATVTTLYDEHDQPVEVLVHDAAHQLLKRATITRDSAGRVLKEEVLLGAEPMFPEMESKLKDAPPEARESLRAALAAAFGPDNVFVSNTYTYDQKGRRISRIMRMGNLREERTTFLYDDHDNPIETVAEEKSGGRQRTHFVYKYDAQGNWTEREVWWTPEPKRDLERSYITRRQITYYQLAPSP